MKHLLLALLLLTPAVAQLKLEPPKKIVAPKANAVEISTAETVSQVNAYWNGARYGVADFVQIAPNGRRTQGKLYFQKPGLLQFEYAAPSPIEVVADGKGVAVRDKKLNTQDIYTLSQTPLQFLLADRIDLGRDKNVTSISRDSETILVSLEEKKAIGGTHRLLLAFDANDTKLKQWIVTDAQGNETSIALHNINTSVRPNASRFKIDYTDYTKNPQN